MRTNNKLKVIKYVKMTHHGWGAKHSQTEEEIFLLDGWEKIWSRESGWNGSYNGPQSIDSKASGNIPDDYNNTNAVSIGNGGQNYSVDIGTWLNIWDDRSPNGSINSYVKVSAKLAEAMNWNPFTLSYNDVWENMKTVCETINKFIDMGFDPGKIINDFDDAL